MAEMSNIKKFPLKNKGKKIGNVEIDVKGFAYLVAIAGSAVALYSGGLMIGSVINNNNTEITADYTSYIEREVEPVYEVTHKVTYFDTLSDLTASYATRENYDKIYEKNSVNNGIKNGNMMAGKDITLYDVPASKLSEFGYTDNYNYFEPTVEIEDRLDFLRQVKFNSGIKLQYDISSAINELTNAYADYKRGYYEDNEYILDDILQGTRTVCDDVEYQYGKSFYLEGKKIYKLSDATRMTEINIEPTANNFADLGL